MKTFIPTYIITLLAIEINILYLPVKNKFLNIINILCYY